jgi:hypothetical protein
MLLPASGRQAALPTLLLTRRDRSPRLDGPVLRRLLDLMHEYGDIAEMELKRRAARTDG